MIDEALIARAADDLDVAAPESEASWIARRALAVAAVITLMLAGAAGAAFVFHDRLSQMIGRWEAIPAARPLTPPPAAAAPAACLRRQTRPTIQPPAVDLTER